MSDMGSLRTTIAVESATRRGEMRELREALVDTGSELTWVPGEVLESLEIEREGELAFMVADGRVITRRLGIAIVHAGGSKAPDWVVFAESGDMVLLGARSLEGMNLRVDPRSKSLVSAGPIVAAAA